MGAGEREEEMPSASAGAVSQSLFYQLAIWVSCSLLRIRGLGAELAGVCTRKNSKCRRFHRRDSHNRPREVPGRSSCHPRRSPDRLPPSSNKIACLRDLALREMRLQKIWRILPDHRRLSKEFISMQQARKGTHRIR